MTSHLEVLRAADTTRQIGAKNPTDRRKSNPEPKTDRVETTHDDERTSEGYQTQEASRSGPSLAKDNTMTAGEQQTARRSSRPQTLCIRPLSAVEHISIAHCEQLISQCLKSQIDFEPPYRVLKPSSSAASHYHDIEHCMNAHQYRYDTEGDTAFYTASLLPPINTETLRALDLDNLAMNASLLHDLHFDRELHLRPNNDRQRAIRHFRAAHDYWLAIRSELAYYGQLLAPDGPFANQRWTAKWRDVFKSHSERIPTLFSVMRNILYDITPSSDHVTIGDVIDEELIMQQIEHGTFDLVAFMKWLTSLLRMSCPPLRDDWLRVLSAKFDRVASQTDVDGIVHGVQELFYVFEAIKLDMANHYIRTHRSQLLPTAIMAEQEHARDRILRGRVTPQDCRAWLAYAAATRPVWELDEKRLFSLPPQTPALSATHLTSNIQVQLHRLISALVTHLMPGWQETSAVTGGLPVDSLVASVDRPTLPPQFKYDRGRLHNISESIEYQVHIRICIAKLHRNLVNHHVTNPRVIEAATRTLLPRLYALVPIDHRNILIEDTWLDAIPSLAIELARVLLPLIDGPSSSRNWQHEPDGHGGFYNALDFFATDLTESLTEAFYPESDEYISEVNVLAQSLRQRCRTLVTANLGRSAEDMAEVFLAPVRLGDGGVQWIHRGQLGEMGDATMVEGLARRVSHVVCVHWIVWGDLVYLSGIGEGEEEVDGDVEGMRLAPEDGV